MQSQLIYKIKIDMERIQKTCLELMKNNDVKKYLIQPIVSSLYNELCIYIWLICIYHILFILIVLANLYIVLKILYNTNKKDF